MRIMFVATIISLIGVSLANTKPISFYTRTKNMIKVSARQSLLYECEQNCLVAGRKCAEQKWAAIFYDAEYSQDGRRLRCGILTIRYHYPINRLNAAVAYKFVCERVSGALRASPDAGSTLIRLRAAARRICNRVFSGRHAEITKAFSGLSDFWVT
jgi:hypothetical protein